ncbi:pseudaminic acid synthase [Paenibacillus phyllosphaerae]|uniref:Pseudaminic acid synthase n=1 Tax=Paenibacillus phyllosphaerae TaxID=274593 RepID=A0A7W5B2M1_9BACL|nr:pseudaminic acid synthase [Paenibacillus phyllosphaerae]MBB3113315.1 pseudaminic acid synthase [Paenibacillus phyllosphaerae]
MNDVTIAGRTIGAGHPPFMIAEMSGNHNQSLDRALAIVEQAARSGAHALKLQTYTADTMTLNVQSGEFRIHDADSLWHGWSLYELYAQACTPWEWHERIIEYGRQLGLIVFSSPFDESAVDFLETLDVPCYKIASFENNDLPLIRKVAATGKPVIMSTGMATIAELEEAVNAYREAAPDPDSGQGGLILLKCTSSYPAPAAECNLLTIPHLSRLFDCPVGLSDHTLGFGAAAASVALGASVVEKHFTLSRSDGGVDAAFSLEPDEMLQLTQSCATAWEALGTIAFGPTEKERSSLIFRRSIYAARNIQPGEPFTRENIRIIRPGLGLAPKYYELVLGRKSVQSINAGTPIRWEQL